MSRFVFITAAAVVFVMTAQPAHAQKCKKRGLAGLFGSVSRIAGDVAGVPRAYGLRDGMSSLLSTKLACLLTPRERAKAESATVAALNDSRPNVAQTWQSDENPKVNGSVMAAAPTVDANGTTCRMTTSINYVGGKEVRAEEEQCQVAGTTTWAKKSVA